MTVINQELDPYSDVYNNIHPLLLASKANSADTFTYNQVMNGPDHDGYIDAMDAEVKTLDNQMEDWDVVTCTDSMYVLPSTWAFRCKRFPDGTVRKLKARFCVRGDRQIVGVDYFETFASVVQWATVRLLLILTMRRSKSRRDILYRFVPIWY